MGKSKKLSPKYQVWVDARKKFKLSDAHIQMAREMGLNPKRLGGLANHRQEPWKAPLHEFIENLYFDKFGKARPDSVRSIEAMVKERKEKKEGRKKAKLEQDESNRSTQLQTVSNKDEDEYPF